MNLLTEDSSDKAFIVDVSVAETHEQSAIGKIPCGKVGLTGQFGHPSAAHQPPHRSSSHPAV
jgi:hypothetical protein